MIFAKSGKLESEVLNTGWRTSWDALEIGDFARGNKAELFLYDRRGGQADIVRFGRGGEVEFDYSNEGWRTTWDALALL